MSFGIHWFRRDLRVAGNPGLRKQFEAHQGKVVGLFCFDKEFLSRPDFSADRFQFFLETLNHLRNELRELGSDLLVLDIGPQKAFRELFQKMKVKGLSLPNSVSWNRDYEPFSRHRDQEVSKLLSEFGIHHFDSRDHLLIEPNEISGPKGVGYQVYSPFARKWLELFRTPQVQKKLARQKTGLHYLEEVSRGSLAKLFKLTWEDVLKNQIEFPDFLKMYLKSNQKNVTISIPPSGALEAYKTLKEFSHKLDDYKQDRDFPAQNGTAKLSLYLKNGSLTVPQIISFLQLKFYKKKDSARDVFFSELIWREFYYHILFHHPYVENTAFVEKYRDLVWENDIEKFEAWKEGRTGFPIVDAGMRELKTTGWMHNRIRMIVASFLTKDLLIDWRWGEKYFMEKLLDGDLAPNNGGWQWAASTGCDPQPYFRIFNPWLQSKRFDPEGTYIKQFVKELSDLPVNELHQPIEKHPLYPEPIVDHQTQKIKALKLYKGE